MENYEAGGESLKVNYPRIVVDIVAVLKEVKESALAQCYLVSQEIIESIIQDVEGLREDGLGDSKKKDK